MAKTSIPAMLYLWLAVAGIGWYFKKSNTRTAQASFKARLRATQATEILWCFILLVNIGGLAKVPSLPPHVEHSIGTRIFETSTYVILWLAISIGYMYLLEVCVLEQHDSADRALEITSLFSVLRLP
jgi:hypothetical protein